MSIYFSYHHVFVVIIFSHHHRRVVELRCYDIMTQSKSNDHVVDVVVNWMASSNYYPRQLFLSSLSSSRTNKKICKNTVGFVILAIVLWKCLENCIPSSFVTLSPSLSIGTSSFHRASSFLLTTTRCFGKEKICKLKNKWIIFSFFFSLAEKSRIAFPIRDFVSRNFSAWKWFLKTFRKILVKF